MLMIIDPQVDFINGALPVEGAAGAMDRLADHILVHGRDYTAVVVTADRHPYNHCSFSMYGGIWPRHCVGNSVGAAVWPALMEALYEIGDITVFLYKGENPSAEEYSVLKNLPDREAVMRLIAEKEISRIDICGLAGDVCVADTIVDGMELDGFPPFNILTGFTASIDGGARLASIASIMSY